MSGRSVPSVTAAGLDNHPDPDGPSFHADGLPLEEGLVELITAESSTAGERHEHLSPFVGKIAIRTWSGEPADPESEHGGVDWILAEDWLPYQRDTFVTPAFAGYVSGHSAFSRAAAEVLARMTGSPYFPGGLGTHSAPRGTLEFEFGPMDDVQLQWATYYDAGRRGRNLTPLRRHPCRRRRWSRARHRFEVRHRRLAARLAIFQRWNRSATNEHPRRIPRRRKPPNNLERRAGNDLPGRFIHRSDFVCRRNVASASRLAA